MSNTKRFLRLTPQMDGKMEAHVASVIDKIRRASAKIGHYNVLSSSQKMKLVKTWVAPIFSYCAVAYSPYLYKSQTLRIQRALNKPTRIALNIPWRKRVSFTNIRRKFGMLSVEQTFNKVMIQEAWRKRASQTPETIMPPKLAHRRR